MKWEYMTRTLCTAMEKNAELEIDLDVFGAKGWELVAVCPMEGFTAKFIFKRPLKQ